MVESIYFLSLGSVAMEGLRKPAHQILVVCLKYIARNAKDIFGGNGSVHILFLYDLRCCNDFETTTCARRVVVEI